MSLFKPATKSASKLRLGLGGPAGSGKTFTALTIATALGQRVAVVDTEHGSASKYSDIFKFDVVELDSFHPQNYIDAIHEAEAESYDTLILDSLSHAWMGKDGALELKDKATARSRSGNSFDAWREVTPLHNALVEAMIASRLHLIATLRSKTEYVVETDERGKSKPRKIGLAPVQRDGLEYEFDVYGELDQDNTLIIGKTRCPALAGGVIRKPGAELAAVLMDWLGQAVKCDDCGKEIVERTLANQRRVSVAEQLERSRGAFGGAVVCLECGGARKKGPAPVATVAPEPVVEEDIPDLVSEGDDE